MPQRTAPPATYPVGPNVVGSGTFVARTITSLTVTIDGAPFLDPASSIDVRFQVQVNGAWQDAVGSTQNGSPTGTWPTKIGSTSLCINMGVQYPDGVIVTGARMGVRVTGSPVDLGTITLTWN